MKNFKYQNATKIIFYRGMAGCVGEEIAAYGKKCCSIIMETILSGLHRFIRPYCSLCRRKVWRSLS